LDALSALYQRMKLLLSELLEIDLLYRLADERSVRADYGGRVRDPLEQRRLQDVPRQVAKVLESQKARRSLAPLPLFPDEPPAPPA